MKFLQDSLGVVEVGKEVLLVLYNYAYVQVKYLNKTVDPVVQCKWEEDLEEGKRKAVGVHNGESGGGQEWEEGL